MTHDFIVNTERVNEYGYRILTDGVDSDQYMKNPIVLYGHRRAFDDPKRVIGRCIKLFKKGQKLIARIEFDEEDEFAKEVSGKVERGYIRMASLYADVKETSTDEKYLLPGQTLETVTACKLVELSIVDIGGNDDALKLSKDGAPVQLKKVNIQNQIDMSLKTIALALGLSEDEKESQVLRVVSELKLAKETAENKANTLETELKDIKSAEATAIVEKAVQLNLIPEALKDQQIKSFEDDFDGNKAVLTKLINDAEDGSEKDAKQEKIREVVLGAKGHKETAKGTAKLTFDYLQKHDTAKLREIRDNEPKEYARLAKDYENGVRHKEE